ncbi:RedV protein [Streptomyces sp. CG1]|uniref:RedV protein n=1 Tax=Streptomyces sp. CG1 TaxID=1287523 RepID=UPI0034E29EB4
MQTQHATSSLERRFGPALDAAASIAAHSPSSHNSQPWAHLRLTSDASRRAAAHLLTLSNDTGTDTSGSPGLRWDDDTVYLALALDHGRTLTALPAHATEMRLSCGMYGQLLLRALATQGWRTVSIAVAGEAGTKAGADTGGWQAVPWPSGLEPLAVAALRHTAAAVGNDAAPYDTGAFSEFVTNVRERRTNRGPYLDTTVDQKVLAGLAAPVGHLLAGTQVSVRHLRAPMERRRFATLVAAHAGRDFSHRTAWQETYSFIRRDDSEARAHGDGFTLEQLFGRTTRVRLRATHLALSPTVIHGLGRLRYDRFLARQLAALTSATPVITAVCLPDMPSDADLLRAGGWLAEYWLRATGKGLALHPISVLLQHDDTRAELQRALGLPGRTVFISRLGYPAVTFPASPRRTVPVHPL